MPAEDPMAAAIRKALEGGFEMPAKVAPRAPRRPSGIQFDGVGTFEADAFGDASAPGGLVFPSSNDDENENENEDENEDGEDAVAISAVGRANRWSSPPATSSRSSLEELVFYDT
jgi:hypothetical protein